MKKLLLSSLASLITAALVAQVPVSKDPHNKITVLEDLTGDYCGWCPNGQDIADQMKEDRNGEMIIIANHEGGFSSGVLEVDEGVLIGNKSGATGWPAGNINRRIWTGSNTAHGRGGTTGDTWKANATTIEGEGSPVNVGVDAHYAEGSSDLDIYVGVYFTDDVTEAWLHLAILQDSLLSYQSGATGTYGYPERVDPVTGDYWHLDVLRDYVTPVKFGPPSGFTAGDQLTSSSKGDELQLTYSWTIPAKIKTFDVVADHLKVVAMISENETFGEIWTGDEVRVSARPTGIGESQALSGVQIYPNPFQTTATVQFNLETATQLQVNVMDVTGKIVQSEASAVYPAGTSTIEVDGAGLQGGLYYVNIIAEDGVMTRKLVLNK